MPIELVFRNHPSDHDASLHRQYLYERAFVPIDLIYEKMRRSGKCYYRNYVGQSQEVQNSWKRKCGGPQPLMHWMLVCVGEIEQELKAALSWTFERHMFSRWCDEDAENAFECGPPRWLVTARDSKGHVVHPGWAIAFDEYWGDLRIVHGKPGSATGFDALSYSWTTCRTKKLPRLLNTMRKYCERSMYMI